MQYLSQKLYIYIHKQLSAYKKFMHRKVPCIVFIKG